MEGRQEPEQSGEGRLETIVSNRLKSRAKKFIRYLDLWHVRGYRELSDPIDLGRMDLRGLDICGQATKGVWGMSWH